MSDDQQPAPTYGEIRAWIKDCLAPFEWGVSMGGEEFRVADRLIVDEYRRTCVPQGYSWRFDVTDPKCRAHMERHMADALSRMLDKQAALLAEWAEKTGSPLPPPCVGRTPDDVLQERVG